jgi:precorrin-6Y C5,15-methyltransferase (decarboxylating)
MPRAASSGASSRASVVPPSSRMFGMAEAGKAEAAPWLTILGIGEDGRAGLSPSAQAALDRAEFVLGPPRHLAARPAYGQGAGMASALCGGIDLLLTLRGRSVVMLASGDPFWFGGGSSSDRPARSGRVGGASRASTFGLAAARLGWALQDCACLGLHAAPLMRLRPHLAPGRRILVLLRDGAPWRPGRLAGALGFGETDLHVLEALGGPREPGARGPRRWLCAA